MLLLFDGLVLLGEGGVLLVELCLKLFNDSVAFYDVILQCFQVVLYRL